MVNRPSNSILNKFEAAYSLAEPDALFVTRLRQSLIQQAQKAESKSNNAGKVVTNKPVALFFTKKAWAIIGLLLLVFFITFIFRQPVLAAAGRLFGYGYLQEIGFFQLENARILKSAMMQEHGDSNLTVMNGLATEEKTILWLKFVKSDATAGGAWLETSSGERIDHSYWNYDANQTDFIRLEFPPLSPENNLTTLMLPAGWQLPLTWIPATQSALPDVSLVQNSDDDNVSATPSENCSEQHGVQICILAATVTGDNTSILVKAVSFDAAMRPGDAFMGLAWTTEQDPVTLRDENGVVYPMSEQHGETLVFPALPIGNQNLTLTIPAVIAKVDIPDQMVVVDMGDDPQPDQEVAVETDIQVLGCTVSFREATFVGDGINSLRVTLQAEPLETVDGITPYMLEMSKPDRIDDLYGSGGLAGSKGLFVELIRPQGMITGVLELPIVKASVIVEGPFEFTFSLSQFTAPSTATPEIANPDTFSPAATPTPLVLDAYQFTGLLPKSGDLLFTIVNGETTGLYFADPSNPTEIVQIARLPGQVYQVYLHPDGLGIDYLVGEQNHISLGNYDDVYYRNAQLYTLQFSDSAPRLLFSFPRGDGSVEGTEITVDWSFDGKLLAYQQCGSQPKPGEAFWTTGWLNLACRDTGNCQAQEFKLEKGLDLYNPQFSPQGFSLMLEGANSESGSGGEDIFLIEFSEQGTAGNIINLSDTDQVDEGSPSWNLKTGQVVTLCQPDVTKVNKNFCFYNPVTHERQDGTTIDLNNPQSFQISLNGDQIFIMDINNSAGGKRVMELHSIDFDGNVGPVLASKQWFDEFTVSANGKEVAYFEDQRMGLNMLSIPTGTLTSVYSTNSVGAVSWMGWVN